MLHKRFKVAKCKTSLKLASSRIKLMKNKKGLQINQIKKDLAQLLESGQDRTARIRVEHAIREEKMVAAYELIEIYCELIVARLPMIESQKMCPLDLKEAITSVVFAAPRCSDIPELLDIQKHFTAKYGKDFISGAIELRPDCGVSRMLVEKLSATAPDVQTKMKVLSAVAKEHNIDWDPTSFEEKESKPPDDLLNGPMNFEKASVDLPKIPTSNAQNAHNHEENPKTPFDFSQQNKRYTLPTDTTVSGTGSERMNVRQSFHSNERDSLSGRENWNMEFTDATSAAQAAAESAERASMAARAAAQLSSQGKITRQYSTEPHEPRARDETPQASAARYPKDSHNNSFNDRNHKTQNQQTRPNEHDTKRPSIPASSKSRNDSYEENPVSNFHQSDAFAKRSSHEDQSPRFPSLETSTKNESTISDEGNVFKETQKTSSYVDSCRDGEDDSDDDGPGFDTGFEYDEVEAKLFFPSPGRESVNPLETTHIWSPRKNTSNPMGQVSDPSLIFSETRSLSAHSAKSEDPSVNFDLSDGSDSESESFSGSKLTSMGRNESKNDIKVKVKPPFLEDNDSDTGKELKFGSLTGGLRNKGGLKYPPYTKTAAIGSGGGGPPPPKKSVDPTPNEADSEEEEEALSLPKRTSTSRVGSGVSRRTKGSPSAPYSKTHDDPEGKTVISTSNEPTRPSSHFYINKSPPPEPDEVSKQPPNPSPPKHEPSKASNLSSETISAAKPSHVHPKLPDYDSLAARIQSLRTNRQ